MVVAVLFLEFGTDCAHHRRTPVVTQRTTGAMWQKKLAVQPWKEISNPPWRLMRSHIDSLFHCLVISFVLRGAGTYAKTAARAVGWTTAASSRKQQCAPCLRG